jgi:glycosyltransferase involved in cell wall biosynthesis
VTDTQLAASVIVPTRDRPASLAKCLAALERQTATSFEVVVVDDGSCDADAVAAVVANASRARVVRASGRGPAAARNLGAASARAPVVCFTDDDCRPDVEWLAACLGRIAAGAKVVAGPTENARVTDPYAAAAQVVTNHLVHASLDASGRRVTFAPTSNLACRAAIHEEERFDERYPLAAGEDREWCARIVARGIDIAYEPTARVEHDPALTLRRFWRQQQRYGRGAYRFHRGRSAGNRMQPMSFYVALVRTGFARSARVGALVLLAQLATAVGILREAFGTRGD